MKAVEFLWLWIVDYVSFLLLGNCLLEFMYEIFDRDGCW
jgi:hypothetical protein